MASISSLIFGIIFTAIGLGGLSFFSGMLTDTEFRKANGIGGAMIPNGLFFLTTVFGVSSILHAFGVIGA